MPIMPSKNKASRSSQRSETRASAAKPAKLNEILPDVDTALTELTRRQIRIGVSLVVRIIAVAVLTAILSREIPAIAENKGIVDALSGVLVLWPFFTAFGKLQAWRIALGRSYARAERWTDAARTLASLHGLRVSLYDATGEGRYWLAVAWRGQGRGEDACRLFAALAALPGGEWAERARKETAAGDITEPSATKSE
jgi:hypothetical protein